MRNLYLKLTYVFLCSQLSTNHVFPFDSELKSYNCFSTNHVISFTFIKGCARRQPIMFILFCHKDNKRRTQNGHVNYFYFLLFLLSSMLIWNQQYYGLLYGTPIVYKRPRDSIVEGAELSDTLTPATAPTTSTLLFSTLTLARTYVHSTPQYNSYTCNCSIATYPHK